MAAWQLSTGITSITFPSIDSRTKMTRSLSVAASLNQTPKEKWRQRLLEVLLDAESHRNPYGARDLHYSAAPGNLLRKLQHDLELPALSLRCLLE